VFGGLVSIVVTQSLDLVSFVGSAVGRASSPAFLRLSTLFLAQALDLATFELMVVRHGATAEANPIVGDLFDSFGMSAVVVAKLALVLLVGALWVASSSRGGRGLWAMIGGLPLALAIAGGLIGGITNAATYLHGVAG
jgi:hypothetical protein